MPKKPVYENTLLAIGDPIYESITTQEAAPAVKQENDTEWMLASLRRGEQWNNLPGTRFEVSRIGQLFSSAKVLLDSQANKRDIDSLRVSGQLGQYRYLHFATHGQGNTATAFESKLILSQDAATDHAQRRTIGLLESMEGR